MSEPPVPAPPVTIAEQLVFLRLSAEGMDADETTRLQEALDVAIEHVQKMCGPITQAARTYLVRPRRTKLVLPVTRVTALVELRDPDGNVVEPYDTDLEAGIITLPVWPATEKAWTVEATTGQDIVSLKRAVKIIASHQYGEHRGGAALPGGRSYPTGSNDEVVSQMGYAIPRRAAELMVPYLRTGR